MKTVKLTRRDIPIFVFAAIFALVIFAIAAGLHCAIDVLLQLIDGEVVDCICGDLRQPLTDAFYQCWQAWWGMGR